MAIKIYVELLSNTDGNGSAKTIDHTETWMCIHSENEAKIKIKKIWGKRVQNFDIKKVSP